MCGENKVIISDKEIYWIEFYDSFHNGLNCDKGGLGRSSFVMSDEQKELLRQINLGKKHSKETKEKMGKSQVKRFTLKNERDKISLSHKGKKIFRRI